jgi:serine protease Do
VTVDDLEPQVRRQLDLPANVKGVLVTDVEPDCAAYEAGLRRGDVIQEVNRQPVKNAEEAVRMTEGGKDKTTLLRVWSRGASHFVVVDESK